MHTGSDLARDPGLRSSAGPELRGLLHDLGHGLATLSYLADGMRRDPTLSGEVRHRLGLMEQELTRLLDLVDLRAREPTVEVFDVRELLEQLVALTGLSARSLLTLRPGEPVALRADKTLLWRMVRNLVDNATRAAGDGGRVEIEVSTQDDSVIVEVVDDGPGFGHGPSGTAALGMGIVDDLARLCGATLRVRSGEHGGTRVRLVFPDAPR